MLRRSAVRMHSNLLVLLVIRSETRALKHSAKWFVIVRTVHQVWLIWRVLAALLQHTLAEDRTPNKSNQFRGKNATSSKPTRLIRMLGQGITLLAGSLCDNTQLKTLRLQGNLSDQVFASMRQAYVDMTAQARWEQNVPCNVEGINGERCWRAPPM